jgi:hypothetical protein
MRKPFLHFPRLTLINHNVGNPAGVLAVTLTPEQSAVLGPVLLLQGFGAIDAHREADDGTHVGSPSP